MKKAIIVVASAISIVAMSLFIAISIPKNVYMPKAVNFGLLSALSEPTQHQVSAYSTRWEKQLASLSIVSFDFNSNRRVSSFRITPDKHTAEMLRSKKPDAGDIPIFTSNSSQNKVMEQIIGGKFECEPGENSPWITAMELRDYVVTSCRTPIDPTVGRVVGYIVLHFKAPLGDEDLRRLQIDTKILANQIYFNEILITK